VTVSAEGDNEGETARGRLRSDVDGAVTASGRMNLQIEAPAERVDNFMVEVGR
jgi:hypothetical protein